MKKRTRAVIDVEGTSRQCGRELGRIWRATLRKVAASRKPRPYDLRSEPFAGLLRRHAPHLFDLYHGMAEGAGLPADRLAIPAPADLFGGCTSFAVAASRTLDKHVICGQTKDVPLSRLSFFQVLKLRPSDGPGALTLTYPGMLFGHGFVIGGCTIFRNSLYAGRGSTGQLPYDAWGLLALHCSSVGAVIDLLERFGVKEPFHCTVCDGRGQIVGIENGAGGMAVLKPQQGVYTHANNVLSDGSLRKTERITQRYLRGSAGRCQTLRDRLSASGRKVTPQLAFAALASHEGYPRSVCNHESRGFCTSAAVIAEPASRSLWVTSGPPCQSWPVEYSLG